jgi:hypothetical protein
MNLEKCIKEVVKAQKALDELAYVCKGANEVNITELKLSIVRAERHLKAAKAVLSDK